MSRALNLKRDGLGRRCGLWQAEPAVEALLVFCAGCDVCVDVRTAFVPVARWLDDAVWIHMGSKQHVAAVLTVTLGFALACPSNRDNHTRCCMCVNRKVWSVGYSTPEAWICYDQAELCNGPSKELAGPHGYDPSLYLETANVELMKLALLGVSAFLVLRRTASSGRIFRRAFFGTNGLACFGTQSARSACAPQRIKRPGRRKDAWVGWTSPNSLASASTRRHLVRASAACC